MDVWYVNHVSMKTDIKVILDTVKTVVKKEGIRQIHQRQWKSLWETNK